MTQPRRVAVLATAKRVAFELGFSLGKEVGFQVRHDRRIGDSCSIKFMTDGILLRELQVRCQYLCLGKLKSSSLPFKCFVFCPYYEKGCTPFDC